MTRLVAEEKPKALAAHIQNFEISDESARIELARLVAKETPDALAEHIQNFEISDESVRIELAHLVAKEAPDALAEHIQNFEISDESVRIELARLVAKEAPDALADYIQNFEISDESVKIELACIYVENEHDPRRHKLEKFGISNHPVRANLYATAYLNAIGTDQFQATDETFKEKFLPADSGHMSLAQAAMQFGGTPHPVIAGFLKAAEGESDPHIRDTLSTWANLVSLRFATRHMPKEVWQYLQGPLEAIWKWRMPAMRYPITRMLVQQALALTASNADSFFAFCKKFTRQHSHLYPVLLFPIFQSATDSPALKRLAALLHRPEFKDVKRQKIVVNALLTLAQADCIPDELKRRLLQAALPVSSDKEAVHFDKKEVNKKEADSLTKSASMLECLALLVQKDNTLRMTILQRLESVQTPDDFNKQMEMLFKELFQLPHLPGEFSGHWKGSRQLVALISYAARINGGGNEKELVLAALRQFINEVVLSPEPELAFRQLRYDPAASKHLHTLANKAQAAFEKWQEPCVYQPSAAFLAQDSSSKQIEVANYLRQRVVADRHVPAGAYPLLEQVLNGQKTFDSALHLARQQAPTAAVSRHVEADLLRLLDEQTPVEKKAALITQLLSSLPPELNQFHADLTDLKKLLISSPLQDTKQLGVIDTDAAEDLFLCGTEVAGSCQHIQGQYSLNKALTGYVLDGKYRMVAIKSANEHLMARRMLRLLWDEQTQQPVLHLERLYKNAGIPKKYEQALVELAWQKARQMGCKLVSHDSDLKSDGDYGSPLKAYPTPWPFEYVDAEGLRVQAGRIGYQLPGAKIVASPY